MLLHSNLQHAQLKTGSRTQPSVTPLNNPPAHHHAARQHKARNTLFIPHATAAQAAALDQQQVALQVPQPPSDYDYKADILQETLEVVQQQYPQLMGLVEAGELMRAA